MAEDQAEMLLSARRAYATRRRRQQLLPRNLFGEPSWDILLGLFIAQLEGMRPSTLDCCAAAGVPTNVALRWVSILEGERLVIREPSQHDEQEKLSLTAQGFDKMADLMAPHPA